MGREVRMVPPTWEHPKRYDGSYKPLHEGPVEPEIDEWFEDAALWVNGEHHWLRPDSDRTCSGYVRYVGTCPDPENYMPSWDDSERTHYQMYENVSEGTPISPPMPTPNALALWLADNEASAFGADTASYEQWLRMIEAGYAPSAVYTPEGGLQSGVAHS